jgi:hypothetical protein
MIPSNNSVQLDLVLALLKSLIEAIILSSDYEEQGADERYARKQQATKNLNLFCFTLDWI